MQEPIELHNDREQKPEYPDGDNDVPPSQPTVLLDVDNTLLYKDTGQFNDALIKTLKDKGITKVYLLTNMDLQDICNYGEPNKPASRYLLIEYLLSQGISVAGVITPADPYFASSQPNSEVPAQARLLDPAYQTLYVPCMQKRLAKDRPLDDYSSEETLEFLFADLQWKNANHILNKSLELEKNQKKRISKYGLQLVNKCSGEHFDQFFTLEEAKQFFITSPNAANHHAQYSLKINLHPKDTIEISETRYSTTNAKAAMIKHAMEQGLFKSSDVVYYFDDDADNLHSVASVIHGHNDLHPKKQIRIASCLMPKTLEAAVTPEQTNKYQRCLEGKSFEFLQKPNTRSLADLNEVFPVVVEENSYSSILSDQCAQTYSVPITKQHALVLTSWNLRMDTQELPLAYSHLTIQNHLYTENGNLRYERFSKICKALKENAELYETAVFVLQGVNPTLAIHKFFPIQESMQVDTVAALKQRMGEGWEAIPGHNGLVTLFNTQKLELRAVSPVPDLDTSCLQVLFKEKNSGCKRNVHVVNVYKKPEENTLERVQQTEAYIKSFRTSGDKGDQISVVAGNFNVSMPSASVYPSDNRTEIISETKRTVSQSSKDNHTACFFADPCSPQVFSQLPTDALISGFMHGRNNVHIKRRPMDPLEVQQIKQKDHGSALVPVVCPDERCLFPYGPKLADLKRKFPKHEYHLFVDPSYHLKTVLEEKRPGKTPISWNCNNINTKLEFMELPFETPTPLSIFFEATKQVPKRKGKTIQIAALNLVSAYDNVRHCVNPALVNKKFKEKKLLQQYLEAEQQLVNAVFDVDANFCTKLAHTMKVFCTWLAVSLFFTMHTAIIGAGIGVAVGACIGSFHLPLLGTMAGALAGLIAGAVIGAGLGFIMGASYGIKKGHQAAIQNKQAFFKDAPTQAFGAAVHAFKQNFTIEYS